MSEHDQSEQGDHPVSVAHEDTAQKHDDPTEGKTQNGDITVPSLQSTSEHENGTQSDHAISVLDANPAPEHNDQTQDQNQHGDPIVPELDKTERSNIIHRTVVSPHGTFSEDLVGVGYSGWVYRLDAVLKKPHEGQEQDCAVEQRVYERLGAHEGILRYFGTTTEGSLILQYASNNSIRHYYTAKAKDNPISLEQRLRWIHQIVKTFAYIHSKGVLQADIHGANILLDDQLNAIVSDFAGCSIDGEASTGTYQPGFYHPDMWPKSVETEIFAIGSLLYEIMTESRPYHDLEIHEMEETFRKEIFPDTDHLPAFGHIIQKCWKLGYKVTEELLVDVEAEGT